MYKAGYRSFDFLGFHFADVCDSYGHVYMFYRNGSRKMVTFCTGFFRGSRLKFLWVPVIHKRLDSETDTKI
jgi:hypothetical protein